MLAALALCASAVSGQEGISDPSTAGGFRARLDTALDCLAMPLGYDVTHTQLQLDLAAPNSPSGAMGVEPKDAVGMAQAAIGSPQWLPSPGEVLRSVDAAMRANSDRAIRQTHRVAQFQEWAMVEPQGEDGVVCLRAVEGDVLFYRDRQQAVLEQGSPLMLYSLGELVTPLTCGPQARVRYREARAEADAGVLNLLLTNGDQLQIRLSPLGLLECVVLRTANGDRVVCAQFVFTERADRPGSQVLAEVARIAVFPGEKVVALQRFHLSDHRDADADSLRIRIPAGSSIIDRRRPVFRSFSAGEGSMPADFDRYFEVQ